MFEKGTIPNPEGRRPGTLNKATLHQREIAEMVLGKPGTMKFQRFVQQERKSLMDGTMAPQIKTLWMHYLIGKPLERFEIKEVPPSELDQLDENTLRDRARRLAVAAFTQSPTSGEADPTVQ